jgi:hypothetical protein
MAILKTRYERATDPTFRADAFIDGGRLVKIVGEGATPSKPDVVVTTAASDYSPGATATDALEGDDVVVKHRGWLLLTAHDAIDANSDVYPAAAGRVQNVGTPAAGDRPFGRALNAALELGDFVWVKPYL